MTTPGRTLLLSFFLTITLGCADDHDRFGRADAAPADGSDARDAASCTPGISWLDATPLARSRTRYATPALTGDGDGFLFASTIRLPDECEITPCVVIEQIASSGESVGTTSLTFARPSDRVLLFASTDDEGHGHFAAADFATSTASASTQGWTSSELLWGTMATAHRTTLDTARGLGAVALDAEHAWVLSHAWQRETTIGEGSYYAISPRIERVGADGATTDVTGLDPTRGALFEHPTRTLSGASAWLLTEDFYGGAPRIAGLAWQGEVLGEPVLGSTCTAIAEADGSVVAACAADGVVHVARLHEDGRRELGPTIALGAGRPVIARAGHGFALAVIRAQAVEVTMLAADLGVRASATAPIGAVDDWASVSLAAAADGVLALAVAPFPTSSDANAAEPVHIVRFRACE